VDPSAVPGLDRADEIGVVARGLSSMLERVRRFNDDLQRTVDAAQLHGNRRGLLAVHTGNRGNRHDRRDLEQSRRCGHTVAQNLPSQSPATKVDGMPVLEFDPPERFVAGTVGPPGQRTFFLQASDGPRLASVSLEKEQLIILADRVNDLLDDFAAGEAAEPVAELVEDVAPLATPIEDEFRVGTMSLGWDADRRVVIVECHDGQAEVEVDEEGEPVIEPGQPAESETVLRVVIEPASARAFARRCTKVVAAGRPPCPFCGGPLDPTGHICPRANGYKR